ncbi:MAG TPA: hypothetical protein P5234_09805 [Thermoanaerobaculaceae bacterium]|nr:hypothetical protein [Thermoanaerobaculaceae bacterium]HRS16524.1 hypothetical protein [Thermoanaerobaculaceae bacterium]
MSACRFVACVGVGVLVAAVAGGAAPARRAQSSPPYTVLVNLRFSSPFVPDGRMSIAEFAAATTFEDVVFRFDFEDASLLDTLYCEVDAEEGRGTLSECTLNDVEPESPRHEAHFLGPLPKEFAAVLAVCSQELERDALPIVAPDPPERVELCFRTLFGRNRIAWGASEGSAELGELELVFEVPWRKLLAGERVSVTVPYRGAFPEDRGTWWIEFLPRRAFKGGR